MSWEQHCSVTVQGPAGGGAEVAVPVPPELQCLRGGRGQVPMDPQVDRAQAHPLAALVEMPGAAGPREGVGECRD